MVVAAGDIADCASEGDEATARLVGGIEGTVLTLGDNAYPDGSAQDFAECYEPTWGRFKDRTLPSPGNHEYETGGASAYFDYFGGQPATPAKDTTPTTWEAGISSPSTATVEKGEIRCGPGSPQGRWLERISPPTMRRRYPCLSPPPAVHFGVVSSRHRTGRASFGDPLRRRRRRGAKRTRPQLPAFPAGP